MVCYCPERQILYIHLPKCGGLTIEAILLKKYNFKHFTFPDTKDPYPFLREANGKLGIFRYILKYSNEAKLYNLKSFRKFSIVRNPYTRGESGIRYLHESSIKNSLVKLPNGKIQQNKRHFPLNIDRFYLTCLNRDYYYIHFCLPQYRSLEDDEGNIDFRIGHFETFMDDLKTILFNEYNLTPFDIDKVHINKSKKTLLQIDLNKVYDKIAIIHEDDFRILNYDINIRPKIKEEKIEENNEEDFTISTYECNSHENIRDLEIEPPRLDL